jgi:hypothetical protein
VTAQNLGDVHRSLASKLDAAWRDGAVAACDHKAVAVSFENDSWGR